MDLDLDPFEDLVPEKSLNHVRVGGKFQPRGKPRPRKPTSKSLPSNAKDKSRSSLPTPLETVESVGFSVDSSTLIEQEEILGNKTTIEPVNSSTQVGARKEGPDSSDALSLKVNKDSSLSAVSDSLQPDVLSLNFRDSCASEAKEPRNDNDGLCLDELDSVDAANLENGASDGNRGWSSSFMKSTEDVGSLGLELDPLSDSPILPAVDNARVGGKFKPKAKVQPRKRSSEGANPISSGTMEEPATVATSKNLVTEEPLTNEDHTNSEVILSTDQHSGFGKPIGENADIFLGLEYIHDFVTQSPNNIEIPLPTSNDEETEEQCSFPTTNSSNSSMLKACNTAGPESVVRADDGILQSEESGPFFNVERPDFLPDSINVYESCSRKFQPRLKVQNGKEKPIVTDVSQDGVGSVAPPTETQFISSETAYENEGLIPAFPSDEMLDYSSMSFSDFIPTGATTAELPINEDVAQASQSSDANILYQEDGFGVPANVHSRSEKQKQFGVSNPPHNSKHFSLGGNEGDKSSRHLRKRAAGLQFVDEPEDETNDNGSFASETPNTSIVDHDNDYNYDYRVDEDDDSEEDRSEITSPKKKASKKSQTTAAKDQNPGRRRKKDNDAPEHSVSKKSQIPSANNKNPGRKRKKDNDAQKHSTQVAKKKFSHSTLRKRRLKELLDAPEDDVDFQGRALKDIILLGEHKENLAVKAAKESKNASTDQRSNNSAHGEESLNEEDGVASEQVGDGSAVDQSNVLFNHNSFMDKTPRSRWSKQDTEKFYEGIRQFGTDLSMIQQLFPGKTRHQMKLKYKKEERQYPLRLSEALSSRAKDNSYFEKVIEQLNLVVELERNKDGSAYASDEEAELNPDTNEDAAKTERKEDIMREENVGHVGGVESAKNDEDEEDEDDIWNSYQSVY